MVEHEPSKTALGVAALRAVHQLIDGTPRILEDPVVLRLLDPSILEQVRAAPERYRTPQSDGLRAHILLRTRYAEDRLLKAFERGVQQVMSLGAGYDTFPYRQPEWAHRLRIFEVDQPATQQEKRERLQNAEIVVPSNVEFVPVDFETTSLSEGLSSSSFDPTLPTFISWLGVMVYLTREASDAVFKFAAPLPRGSEIVFTFTTPPSGEQTAERPYPTLAELSAQVGEPWINFITPDELVQHLRTMGFSEVTIPTTAELASWYLQNRTDGLQPPLRRSIASAIV